MSMTESEAKRPNIAIIGGGRNVGKSLFIQTTLLEELESYRAIGTVEECRIAVERMQESEDDGK